ncbi:hypothetical protein PMZ80_010396 [Knufia obscura]|uniref:DUF3074 domain-containing protein n=2 Tax=Knufia TaxID=430999 RepID=A0AAN8ECC6_9EURO|nr:hypothetical protein PMZ80_010396 [Knufia obscura]KAK5951903.1 hypothetical protein OHC33_007196 [Knufia fluminis]
MAELHEALKYLGPAQWSGIPTGGQELDSYLEDLFSHCQLIVDSVPIPTTKDAPQQPQAQPHGRATKASEVTLSSERSAPPPFGHEKLQKEWGKPMKMKASENPLGLSVYKMSGKDSKGAWFARCSVHEGISFSKFKKSLQMEFEKSLAEPGPPGTGNVRGIGGEERVEQIKTDKGKVEVFRLSAQFPGPTAARDFVTMLVTSDKAMHVENETKDHFAPRHYMIVSRPCDHPNTQPRQGFVRGFYESIEFIREVPRKLKTSQSSIDLGGEKHTSGAHRRSRAATDAQASEDKSSGGPDPTDPEDNPVEWMMITRSDPGGGIPRFLVERGTPSSICADAVKFVDWACQNEDDLAAVEGNADKPQPQRTESYQGWRNRSLVGVEENGKEGFPDVGQPPQTAVEQMPTADQSQNNGLYGAVAGAAAGLRSYTPQAVLDRLPAGSSQTELNGPAKSAETSNTMSPAGMDDDQQSITSTSSFASAEDHLSSSEDEGAEKISIDSQQSANTMTGSKEQLQHERELRKLDDRKQALHKKFADTQSKFDEARSKQADSDAHQTQKVIDKHERDLKKHQAKFHKELEKIERKQEKERRKAAEKAKRQVNKDKETKLTRERDEARQELDLVKKEAESLKGIVQDLQKENTALVMKLGRAGLNSDVEGLRSRGSSLSRQEKNEKKKENLAAASATASMKSSGS